MDRKHIIPEIDSLGRFAKRTMDRRLRSLDLTSPQIRALIFLSHNDNACQHDIEDELGINRASVSSLVDTLENMGLIQREKVESDGRRWRLVITDEGRRRLKDAKKKADELEDIIWSELGDDDVESFLSICSRLKHILEENQC